MPPRYNTGYGRSSSMYRYNEPSIAQYESFFNPIPLEFVQQQFDRRQGAYDEGYGMAIGARDQFGGTKVGAPDMPYKNQLIGQFVNDIDKTVQDQFGGDWGKAAKSVARSVTDMRGNEFWQKAEIMDKRREEERALVAKYGPKALKFKSIQNQSVYDPATGKLVSPDQMNYDVMERGDWEGSVAKIFAGLKGDQKSILLKKYQNDPEIQNYLQYGTTEGISDTKLRMLASDKDLVNSFISSNQDFKRAAEELPDYFGSMNTDPVTGKKRSAEDIASDYIYGQIKPRQYSQTQMNYTHDAGAEARASASAKNESGAFAPERENATYDTGYGTDKKTIKTQKNYLFDQKGNLLASENPAFGLSSPTGTRYGMDVQNKKPLKPEEIKAYEQKITEELKSNPVWQSRKSQYDMIKNIVGDIKKNNKELITDKSDWEIYSDYINDTENKYKVSMDLSLPVIKPDIKKTIGESIASNINGTEFFLTDGSKVTRDWNDKNGIGNITGLTYIGFQEMLRKGDLALAYNKTRGSLYAEIPIIEGDVKYSSDGTINFDTTKSKGKKTVYFSPDRELAGVSKLMPYLDQLLKDSKANSELPEGIAAIFPTIHYDKSKVIKDKDINDQEVFLMKDSQGNDEWYSLNEVRNTMAQYVNSYLSTYYNVKQ
jgi:hypothetical protein